MPTNIITRAHHNVLKAELDHLWHTYRPEITQKVTWAASLGDRSENCRLPAGSDGFLPSHRKPPWLLKLAAGSTTYGTYYLVRVQSVSSCSANCPH